GEPVRDPAQSKTLSMRGNSSHGNREIPSAPAEDGAAGRSGKAPSRTPGTHAGGKSDGCIVPRKPPNKGRRPAEAEEGRQTTQFAFCPFPGSPGHPPCGKYR